MGFKVDLQAKGMKELGQALRQFAGDIKAINRRSLMKVGLKAESIAVKHITAQDLPWAPLNARYLRWKTKHGQSEKILVQTSTYVQSITSTVSGDTVEVGVKKDVTMPAQGEKTVTVASVATVMEYGSLKRGIPARPLWGPTLRETADWLVSTKFFAQQIIDGLRKKYGAGAGGSDEPASEPSRPTSSAPPRSLNTGKRGGKFYVNASGRKVYQKRK